jgi:small subunit ribosomal protein S9
LTDQDERDISREHENGPAEIPAEGAEAPPEAAAEAPAEPAAEVEAPATPAADDVPAEAAPEAAPAAAAEAAPEAVAPEPEAVEAQPAGEAAPAADGAADGAAEAAATDEPAAETVPEATPATEEAPRTAADLAADARYTATGKRKSSVARVILMPGTGRFVLNGRPLEVYFPRRTHQVVVQQPLETAGYIGAVDIVARIHGGGISGQADAVRHGIAKALIEADPALRGELKRRQLLTRDPRVKERRKAGLKKARKRPQFSKR